MIKNWWLSLRPFSFTASVIPILLGAIIGAQAAGFNLAGLIITLIAGFLYHSVANLFNSYWDWENRYDSPSGTQVIPVLLDERLGAQALHRFSQVILYLSTIVTILLGILYGLQVFLIAVLGLLGAYFYTAPPISYKYRGWSLPAVFILMGLLLPASSYLVQAGEFNSDILLLASPLALLTTAILQVNELRDYNSDLSTGGITFTIMLGKKLALYFYFALILLPYLLVVCFYLIGKVSIIALLCLLTLRQAFALIVEAKRKVSIKLDVATAKLHMFFGILYLLSFIIS